MVKPKIASDFSVSRLEIIPASPDIAVSVFAACVFPSSSETPWNCVKKGESLVKIHKPQLEKIFATLFIDKPYL